MSPPPWRSRRSKPHGSPMPRDNAFWSSTRRHTAPASWSPTSSTSAWGRSRSTRARTRRSKPRSGANRMWGVIPAAGHGTRIQPLAFSKELLPLGERADRPRAVSEYLVERMLRGGADKICFVIAPGKSDIVEYYGTGRVPGADIAFVVQPKPVGLCDAVFRARPVLPVDEPVLVGLPDTI